MITGYQDDEFTGLNAAHIFPVARQSSWNRNDYGNAWISDTSPASSIAGNGIYSPQNGLLLQATVHTMFDQYKIAINPQVRINTMSTFILELKSNKV